MKSKIVKTFESFVANKNFKFEVEVIDPILSYIRENQVELTTPEGLPFLAKLGYMYNTLWYAGRLCWGSEGILRKTSLKEIDEDGEEVDYYDCEENPKYKIDDCSPENDTIESLIYGAWGMHVSNEFGFGWDIFYKTIYEGEELSDLKKLMLKKNKTLGDWITIMTDKDYPYKQTKKSTMDHLLCTIGSGNKLNKEGFIVDSSGGGEDKSQYGDWKNAKFTGELKAIVDKIMSMPEVEETLKAEEAKCDEYRKDREGKDGTKLWMDMADSLGIDITDLSFRDIMNAVQSKITGKPKVEKYKQYYPLSTHSLAYRIFDKESLVRMGVEKVDQSYIDGVIEICNDILEHESEERPENVKYANIILKKAKGEYKEFDKYGLFEDIKNSLLNLTDHFGFKEDLRPNDSDNLYNLYLNDTKSNEYADNNYFLKINSVSSDMPDGISNNIEYLKDTKIYDDLVESFDKIKLLKDIKEILFYYKKSGSLANIDIEFYVNRHEYQTELKKCEEMFISQGFNIGNHDMTLKLPKLDIILSIGKPKPLGSTHPNNKDGRSYFSLAKNLDVYSSSGEKIINLFIDERGFNTIRGSKPADARKLAIYEWIMKTHKDIKEGNSDYGNYNSENRTGKEGNPLYAHTLMLSLRDNQDKLKI